MLTITAYHLEFLLLCQRMPMQYPQLSATRKDLYNDLSLAAVLSISDGLIYVTVKGHDFISQCVAKLESLRVSHG